MKTRILQMWLALMLITAPFTGCRIPKHSLQTSTLRLATTTSTENSGLLKAILPSFEVSTGSTVEVVAIGTGQALALGKTGDADVLLVHAPDSEKEFVAAGHGTARHSIMYNDFIIVGPRHDPAKIRGIFLAANAMVTVAATGTRWASRGDESGTHIKEQALWRAAGLQLPAKEPWYYSLGQGMSATLNYANETDSYALTDRGTYLAQSDHLPYLALMVGGHSISANIDPALYNPYGVIPVHPDKNGSINHQLALQFVDWIISVETGEHIAAFGVEQFGQPLFYPQVQSQ